MGGGDEVTSAGHPVPPFSGWQSAFSHIELMPGCAPATAGFGDVKVATRGLGMNMQGA